jgi:hypothetical protein
MPAPSTRNSKTDTAGARPAPWSPSTTPHSDPIVNVVAALDARYDAKQRAERATRAARRQEQFARYVEPAIGPAAAALDELRAIQEEHADFLKGIASLSEDRMPKERELFRLRHELDVTLGTVASVESALAEARSFTTSNGTEASDLGLRLGYARDYPHYARECISRIADIVARIAESTK